MKLPIKEKSPEWSLYEIAKPQERKKREKRKNLVFWKKWGNNEVNEGFGVLRDGWALVCASSTRLTRVPRIENRPIPLWPRHSTWKAGEIFFFVPNFLYSEGRLHRQPRNRGATEVNVYQRFLKSEIDNRLTSEKADDRLMSKLN